MLTRNLRGAVACALLTSTTLASSALAQVEPPPRFLSLDENGVDLTTGKFTFFLEEASIGAGEGELALSRTWSAQKWHDPWSAALYERLEATGTVQYIVLGGTSVKFTKVGSSYVPSTADGSTLTFASSSFTYTDRNGTVYKFNGWGPPFLPGYPCNELAADNCYLLGSVTQPNGRKTNVIWTTVLRCSDINCTSSKASSRVDRVETSDGYRLAFTYALDTFSGVAPPVEWTRRTSAKLSNRAFCDPGSTGCTGVNYSWPQVAYASITGTDRVGEITDPLGRKWNFTYSINGLTGIRRPGSASDDFTITYGTNGSVSKIVRDGVTTNYAFSATASTATMTITDALGNQRTVISDVIKGKPTSYTDELGKVSSYTYDANSRLTRASEPLGNAVEYVYDTRGNVTTTRFIAKAGSGLPSITTTSAFDPACANPKVCNQPTSITDERGSITDYTYDPNHGGVLSITAPAPTTGAVRPQQRFAYTAAQAQYRDGAGTIIPSGVPTYLLTATSECQTLATCTGTADEVKTSLGYGSTGVPNNLLPRSIAEGAGNGLLTATTNLGYDETGNLITIDGPLAGAADTTRLRYDAARQLVGKISPDPDGTGSLPHRAERTTYRQDGLVEKRDTGTVTDQSDAAWSAFTSLQAEEVGYDSNSRPTSSELTASGTTYTLSQRNYDALGRVNCEAVRMNPATFASPPASACTAAASGSFGPDRISKNVYDDAGRVTKRQKGVATTSVRDEFTATYTDNGDLATLTDAENNETTFEYDGHNRVSKVLYPSVTKGAGTSNSGDFEQLTYDASSNVISRRLRDGQTIAFSYDKLNRPITKNLPGTEPTVSYSYDNLGRLTAATQSGLSTTFGYDALSRQTSEAQGTTNLTRQFDLADRLTRTTWWDGFYVQYDRLVTGEATRVRENGATSGQGLLASFSYDSRGRRTQMSRGNAASTTYSYDPISRLTTLTHNLAGSTNDLTISSISYNPDSQIVGQVRSNDAYAWTEHDAGSTTTVTNGLNQLVSVGGVAADYDDRGNLISEPVSGRTYGYSSENRLVSGSGGVSLAYDPVGRLSTYSAGSTVRFVSDDVQAAAELDGANAIQRRYVWGDAPDELIAWYDGPATANRRWSIEDERGSPLAAVDGAGASLGINRYDDFGQPQTSNVGRVQYTGKMWLPELGLYNYKARSYAPHLGRFVQPDPIGYADGLNLYTYVGADPINLVDPLGLNGCPPAQGDEIVVCGKRRPPSGGGAAGGSAIIVANNRQPGAGFRRQVQLPAKPLRREATREGRCQAAALRKGVVDAALNAAGFIPGGRAAAVAIRVGATSAQGARALVGRDGTAGSLAASSYAIELAEAAVSGGHATGSLGKAGKTIAENLPVLGQGLAWFSLISDAYSAYEAYQACSERK